MTGTMYGLMIYPLQNALKKKGFDIPFAELSYALGYALEHVNQELDVNDCIELPSGSTLVKTYDIKVGKLTIRRRP